MYKLVILASVAWVAVAFLLRPFQESIIRPIKEKNSKELYGTLVRLNVCSVIAFYYNLSFVEYSVLFALVTLICIPLALVGAFLIPLLQSRIARG